MPDITALAGKVAGIVSLAAYFPYIFSIVRGKTIPNRATWWIWTMVGLMLGASYYSSGASNTIWVPVSYIIGPLTTAILSIRYGVGGWERFDKYCLAGTGVSLALWCLFSLPLIALLINLFIDLLGALPTIRKVYLKPGTENTFAWILFIAGNTINLFAVETWSFTIAVYPIYMFCASGSIAALVCFRKKR